MTDEERTELEALRKVADAAAFALIDLAPILSSANEEYMRGNIPRSAYECVLMRQALLLIALHNAGYTEKHELFNCPTKPAPPKIESGSFTAPSRMDAFSSPA